MRIAVGSAMLSLVVACTPASNAVSREERDRWTAHAARVTITRDDWGIAHVRGATDADAVFGMIYAQAEDDFNRIETNYLNAMGRLAEAEGDSAIWRDLRMKLFVDPDSLRAMHARSPAWLQTLMQAWADGLNYFLDTHPAVTPRVLSRFEPWMALSFSEGSIGGDIEQIELAPLRAFYGGDSAAPVRSAAASTTDDAEPRGSNGIAIAPANTVNKRALLLINPHTSFFFRSELQMTSDEGLNAYGAVTWGQFFVYQGFNERAGWMHTSSGADNIDEYAESIVRKDDGIHYRYDTTTRRVTTSELTIPFKTDTGMSSRRVTVYRTHHGPIVRGTGDQWISVRLMYEPVRALTQSYTRTRATDYASFVESMRLHTNSSNNTIYADADGTIAYFHANFVPKRDTRFDWTRPVDGADPATEWNGIHTLEESPNVVNPASGWLYNANNWPWSAAGQSSPKRGAFPAYFEDGASETPRGHHAIRVLAGRTDFTLDRLVEAAYDSYLPAFAQHLPPAFRAYDNLPSSHALKARLAPEITALRAWDFRWGASSVPTSLAVFWGEEMHRRVAADARRARVSADDYIATRVPGDELLRALVAASDTLAAHFGSWQTPWGDINRFQRRTGDIVQTFSDTAASIPVAFTSARYGSLASFGARAYPGTKRWYGTSGNSFVAVVEFGDSVRARAVSAGGESGDPRSPHFNDQAARYAAGDLRDVYFYPSQLAAHTVRTYRPGDQ